RVLVLRVATLGEWRRGGRLLGDEECGGELRDAVHRVRSVGNSRTADRRRALRPLSQLSGGVLHGGCIGCGRTGMRIRRETSGGSRGGGSGLGACEYGKHWIS